VWKDAALHRRFEALARECSLNIPRLYVTPPILWGEDVLDSGQTPEDEELFTDLSPTELRKKWDSLLQEYGALGNEFRALEKQRVTTAAELARFRTEVEALEAELGHEAGEKTHGTARRRSGA
jgi:hypothetical protein